ncbi:MAG: Thioredoxin reductase [Deltaproteobacteria bacterium ADurb.Bin510]|nr:MAG: Thioredoxin reductase [Deltaproteobacteria bacterium ADurb.Bin510]
MADYEVAIIGQGPAGLSAAIYTARAGLRTVIVGCDPKVAGDYKIDNYFGFSETITGAELIERGKLQAGRFGAELGCDKVLAVHLLEAGFEVVTPGRRFTACSLILATGVSKLRPKIARLEELEGRGVSYCVSCDGFFYRGKKVAVLGEGSFAANQALELREYTADVRIITQGKPPSFSDDFAYRLEQAGVPVSRATVASLEGEGGLSGLSFKDGGRTDVDGLFIALGEASALDFAATLGLEREGVGEGAIAGHSAIDYVKNICRA